MSIVVEDNTGLETAESYASVLQADSVATAHGLTTWAALSTSTKEAALRVGTMWIDDTFRARFDGVPKAQYQALAWPREGATGASGNALPTAYLPLVLVKAAALAAIEHTISTAFTAKNVVTSETVGLGSGALAESVSYGSGGKSTGFNPVSARLAISPILQPMTMERA